MSSNGHTYWMCGVCQIPTNYTASQCRQCGRERTTPSRPSTDSDPSLPSFRETFPELTRRSPPLPVTPNRARQMSLHDQQGSFTTPTRRPDHSSPSGVAQSTTPTEQPAHSPFNAPRPSSARPSRPADPSSEGSDLPFQHTPGGSRPGPHSEGDYQPIPSGMWAMPRARTQLEQPEHSEPRGNDHRVYRVRSPLGEPRVSPRPPPGAPLPTHRQSRSRSPTRESVLDDAWMREYVRMVQDTTQHPLGRRNGPRYSACESCQARQAKCHTDPGQTSCSECIKRRRKCVRVKDSKPLPKSTSRRPGPYDRPPYRRDEDDDNGDSDIRGRASTGYNRTGGAGTTIQGH